MTVNEHIEKEKKIDDYLQTLYDNNVVLNLSLADNKRSFNFEIKPGYLISLRKAHNFDSMATVVGFLLDELAKKEFETVNLNKNES